jgi:hypothetical protein
MIYCRGLAMLFYSGIWFQVRQAGDMVYLVATSLG